MLWFWMFCWFFTIAECVAKLLPETFTSTPTPSTLSATRIFVKLVRAMFVHIVLVVGMSVGIADVYWPMMCYNFILTVTDTHTRHMFRMETVSGQARALRYSRRSKQPSPLSTIKPHRSPSLKQFRKVFAQNLVLVLSGLSAGAFVHIASSIEMQEQWELVLFALCSQTIKLLIQAAAKLYLGRRKRTPSLRTMAIIVAAPTILVDTQLRTVLLCLDSKAMTLAGSYPLPRVGVHPQDGVVKILRGQSLLSTTASLLSPELEGVARVQKLTALHAAEVYAGMHGEFSFGGNASSSSTHEI
ncbi:uncharacterized protein PITG_13388 [Phytophthora infestans T30-4]|uniref:Transmembrane protein n=1 Tax=Phytophthora infestans (strain T30-4) TaxID=403677 RepID=D0NLV4_PHYIT|nr:uncharacterized protein PITG_13388 [Phytophthora infestans T30-4]EEY60651.1 conserved hypothetical protein [Phytophthora infestans T30-4]|eukprot:XP_002900024.1 conserved hypothetical protein [Phytophthora infestans T30-4]